MLGSQNKQDTPISTDILRITLCTALKTRVVIRDDHNGKILKYVTGHGGLTEGKDKRRGSEHRCMTGKGNLGGVPKKVPPCWCHSGTPSIPRRERQALPAWPFTMHPLSLNPKQSTCSSCYSCAIIDYRFAACHPALQLLSITIREGSSNTRSRNPEEQHVFITLSNTDSFSTP